MSGRLLSAALALVALPLAGCAQIPAVGIRTGADRVERALVCGPMGIGDIQNLAWLPGTDGADGVLWIGGEQGAVHADRDGAERGRVEFDVRMVNPRPIDVDGDGVLETMDCGGGWSPVELLDATGHLLWRYPRDRSDGAADQMAAGQVGPEHEPAFVVGMNGSDGVRVLDLDGNLRWLWAGTNVSSVAVLDLDADGCAEILHSDVGGSGGRIWVRDDHGRKLRRLDTDFYGFSLIRWPGAGSPLRLFAIDDDERVQIVDPCVEPHGDVLAKYELPDGGHTSGEGSLVRLDPAGEPWLAVIRTIRATWQRSALYLFDGQRRLVYHEVLPFPDLGLAVVPSGATDELLVGAGVQVWRYTLRAPPSRPVAN